MADEKDGKVELPPLDVTDAEKQRAQRLKGIYMLPLVLLIGCSHTFRLPPTPLVPAPHADEPGADGDGPNLSREPKANLCDSLKGKPEELSCLMGLIAPERK